MASKMKKIRDDLPAIDPRYFQIGMLTLLLIYGLFFLDFEVNGSIAMTILICAQLTQLIFSQLLNLPRFDPRSALISSLSLCLLLRTDSPLLAGLAATIAIGSKFVIRWKNKHIFNPTNFALVIMLLCSDQVWVSPGQWGKTLLLATLIISFGLIVINRSRRSDITLAFLGFYSLMLFGRASWLGDPLVIPLHQLQSGALLIFAFFMISDPMTTPNSRPGRILFAALVTLGTTYVQFVLYLPNGVLYALVTCCLLTPIIDRLLPAEKFQWHLTEAKPVQKVCLNQPYNLRKF